MTKLPEKPPPVPAGLPCAVPRTEILLEQAGWVRQIAQSMLRDEEDARDLAQDVMTTALESRVPGDGPGLRAWLRTVARRKAMRKYRRRDLERAALRDMRAGLDDSPSAGADDYLRLHDDLVKALRSLDSGDRRLMVQRYIDGVTPRDLASQAGVSPGVMRKRLSRSLARLREAFGKRLGPEGQGNSPDPVRRALLIVANPAFFPSAPPHGGPSIPAPSPPVPSDLPPRVPALGASSALFTMGIQKTLLVAAGILALGGIALFGFAGSEAPLAPTVAGLEPEDKAMPVSLDRPSSTAARTIAAGMPLPVDTQAETRDSAPSSLAYLEVLGADGEPRPDAKGLWIGHDGAVHPLDVGEDGRCSVPAGREVRVVVSAKRASVVIKRLPALAVSAVESVTLKNLARLRMRVTVGGEAPDEPIRFGLNAGGAVLAGGVHSLGLGARRELERLGLVRGFPPIETDAYGMIDAPLPGNLDRLNLGLPQGFLVNTINGEPGNELHSVFGVFPGRGVTTIDLRPLPRVSGRIVWDDTGRPYAGPLMAVRTFGERDPGETVEEFFEFETRLNGRFSIGLHEIVRGPKSDDGYTTADQAALTIGLEAKHPQARLKQRHTFQVDPLAGHQELGDIRIVRRQLVRVRVVGELRGAEQPLIAGLASASEVVTTDRHGRALISLGNTPWIDVLAPGYEFVRVWAPRHAMEAQAHGEPHDEQPLWKIRLRAAPALRVQVPNSLLGEDSTHPPTVTLRFAESPFGSFHDTAGPRPELSKRLYRAVFGMRHVQQSAVGETYVEYVPGIDGLVTIPGLRKGAAVEIEWSDFLGGAFASLPLTFQARELTVQCPRPVEPAFLVLDLTDDSGGAAAPGGFAVLQGPTRRRATEYFKTATLELGPLIPGRYSLRVFSDSAGRFETKNLILAPGVQRPPIDLK